MEYAEIIEAIGREAADLPPEPRSAAQAVAPDAGRALPRGEARHSSPARPAEAVGLYRGGCGGVRLVDVVFKHVRAVFATLAEAVDAEEWFGMIAELPAEYSGLIPERSA